ncbi:exocyst subunit exo70 family protein E1 [Forsythia ovata]|uniref:Exocyst subunit exo70 family protein E1 n=1 Tax=Forsythia ovata TaxID=205694 RepID=A0ABD1UDB7_9LAMI
MEDCKPNTAELEAEEDLIAAAQHIVKALRTNRNLTADARKILANLGVQLSNVDKVNESKDEADFEEDERLNEIELQLNEIWDKIMDREKDESMIWDRGPGEAYEYLKAMARLEEEFRHLLVQNRQPFEPEHVSFRSSEEDIVEASSIVSFGDDSVEDVVQRDSTSQRSEDYVFELVHPDVIPDITTIAKLMFDSNFGQECSQMFINVQRDALDDCLFILEVEKLSIEDVLKMEWNTLNSKIRRWMWAVKIFVRIYLAGEKLLSDQIFGELDSASSVCFVESFKTCNFTASEFWGSHSHWSPSTRKVDSDS